MISQNILRQFIVLSCGAGFVLTLHSFVGCSATPPSGTDCTSDTDCSGDDICTNGSCGPSEGTSSSASSGSSSGSGSSSSGGASSSSSGSGSSSSGNVVVMPVCRQTCTTAAECANNSMVPIQDADNWNCNAGLCEYIGCNSTQECNDTFMNMNYTCSTAPGSTIKSCRQKCAGAGDCTNGSVVPILDADNWSCNGGFCEYNGCNSTQECTDTYMNTNYVCVNSGGAALKSCQQKCNMPSECPVGAGTPILDGDNWACNAGVCEYQGCNSTQECIDSYMKSTYICQ